MIMEEGCKLAFSRLGFIGHGKHVLQLCGHQFQPRTLISVAYVVSHTISYTSYIFYVEYQWYKKYQSIIHHLNGLYKFCKAFHQNSTSSISAIYYQIGQSLDLIIQNIFKTNTKLMLTDLKLLEDKLYLTEALEQFNNKYPTHELIKQLNKASKKQTRERIRRYLSKLAASNHYRDFLFACLSEEQQKRKEFIKYVSSEHSQEFFLLLQQKRQEVLSLIENNQVMVPVLMRMVGFEFGLKLIKLFKELYELDSQKHECLFSHQILKGLEEGLGFSEGEEQPVEGVDSVAQMRYLQIVVNVALVGGKCFNFVESLMNRALGLYNTEDILLKMALVQIISVLGDSPETAKLLHQHKIWKLIEKDASDVDQEFYVRKFLLLLLVDLVAQGHYSLSPKMAKDIQAFLRFNITANGEYLEAAVDLIGHLFRSVEGCQIVIQDKEVFSRYLRLSMLTIDSIKRPYYQSLRQLTNLQQGDAKKSPKYRLTIYILNSIGNPESYATFSSTALQTNYIEAFSRWFAALLQLPFEQAEIVLVDVFANLLGYYEVAESLLQVQETTKYLLKPLPGNESSKVLRAKKVQLINSIIQKGEKEWKGLELSEYSRSLQKLLKNRKEEAVYALDIE